MFETQPWHMLFLVAIIATVGLLNAAQPTTGRISQEIADEYSNQLEDIAQDVYVVEYYEVEFAESTQESNSLESIYQLAKTYKTVKPKIAKLFTYIDKNEKELDQSRLKPERMKSKLTQWNDAMEDLILAQEVHIRDIALYSVQTKNQKLAKEYLQLLNSLNITIQAEPSTIINSPFTKKRITRSALSQ